MSWYSSATVMARPITEGQGRALYAIAMKHGGKHKIAEWCQPYGVTSDRDLTEKQAAEIIAQYGG